ncbi:helix-turn-helix domain-containing protein [Kosakonia sp. BYX6]|uniref:Helix-turn-helix domain-containing protein n=1 Tax=Kosakonia calanthes TaxID=3139408 RepID=A0ABZ3B1W0_9ENTR
MGMQQAVILEIQQWIDDNIDRPLKIEEVAMRAGYSKWHLQRLFQQVLQIPLGIYIREKRLESAAQELLESGQTVMTISTKYGYDSQQTFTRTFTRKYRMPPGVWRRHIQHMQER